MAPLVGKPLIQYTIDCAKAMGLPLYVWTRDIEIMDYVSDRAPIFYEPLSMYDTPSNTTYEKMARINAIMRADYVILLQPTHPLRYAARISRWLGEMMELDISYGRTVMQTESGIVDSGSCYIYDKQYLIDRKVMHELSFIEDPPFDIHTKEDLIACETQMKEKI
jgi:CMP-N-acetylneuraminic acid synthetase